MLQALLHSEYPEIRRTIMPVYGIVCLFFNFFSKIYFFLDRIILYL